MPTGIKIMDHNYTNFMTMNSNPCNVTIMIIQVLRRESLSTGETLSFDDRVDGWLIVFHSWKLRTPLFQPTVGHMTSREGVRERGREGGREGAENKKASSVMFLPLLP